MRVAAGMIIRLTRAPKESDMERVKTRVVKGAQETYSDMVGGEPGGPVGGDEVPIMNDVG